MSALVSRLLTRIPENLKVNLYKIAGVNAVCQFNITGDTGGSSYVDMLVTPPAVIAGSSDKAKCTITCSEKVGRDHEWRDQRDDGRRNRQAEDRGRHGCGGALRMIIR